MVYQTWTYFSLGNNLVLVQKLQDNCNKSTNLGHTDTTNLKKVRDWYGKGKCIQMETLSA
ncbi:hypothetical protein BK732_11385 [Bacillus thuringiensis serovar navarrensis]|uniref:Uncharacterized protein n=1 Tax=Bacillus thuringiensis serovar navarrensis TaxID=339658 RepID=A0A243AHJ7_BACTU|nr:hypothetical protein BK732_11385 [Bacillus thuringiensis serovar navarrensis]